MAFEKTGGVISVGITLGLAAVVLTPILLPVITRTARPLARAAIKTGLILYERGCEAVAEAQEVIEDVMAEVRTEWAPSDMSVVGTTAEAEAPATTVASMVDG